MTSYRWQFDVQAQGCAQNDCRATVTAISLKQALTKVTELLGLDGRGPDADCAGGLSRGALLVVRKVEEL